MPDQKYAYESELKGLLGENEEEKLLLLRKEVTRKRKHYMYDTWLPIVIIFVILFSLLYFTWNNSPTLRSNLVTGSIAMLLALWTFLKNAVPNDTLTQEKVEDIIGTKLPTPKMDLIRKTVKEKAPDTSRWVELLLATALFVNVLKDALQ